MRKIRSFIFYVVVIVVALVISKFIFNTATENAVIQICFKLTLHYTDLDKVPLWAYDNSSCMMTFLRATSRYK